MKKLLTIATVTSVMFLAGCNTNVQTLPSAPGEPTVQIPMWISGCNGKNNNIFRPLREVVNIKPIDNATCLGRKLHSGETGGWHRNEMRTDDFSPFITDTHIFESDVSIKLKSSGVRKLKRPVFIKQIHSGIPGHATSVVLNDTIIQLVGQFKTDPTSKGYNGRVTSKPAATYINSVRMAYQYGIGMNPLRKFDWKFDGTVYRLKVVNEFDGSGGFWTHVYIDGEKIVSGYANYPRGEGYEKFMKPKNYYHKFGIYGPTQSITAKFINPTMKYFTAR